MQLITQSFVTYLKRVTLIALLAVLGYGIGTALRPADSSLLAVPTQCNEEFCTWVAHTSPPYRVCLVGRIEHNTDTHCTNFHNGDAHDCSEAPCPDENEDE